jgi:16S rRNA C967 or C1407 C5-methylase (RsmB/RsmF family)/NOL1/NOP2/fmu family ribosome biogenesis protein
VSNSRKLPAEFVARIVEQFTIGHEELIQSLDEKPSTSIRLNTKKEFNWTPSDRVQWAQHGYILKERPIFTLDPYFHAGAYYVQESSSMFVDHVLSELRPKIELNSVLDLCASPGGKSTIILDHLNENQHLVANELIPNRNHTLRENLTKWGKPNFLVSQNKVEDFRKLKNHFDLILVDAPCSGEGLFRKDDNARKEWKVENLKICSERQLHILTNIWSSLADGGYLIYSTCTFNPDENENLLVAFKNLGFEFEAESMPIKKEWNINKIEKDGILGYQFLPHQVIGEGFFCSILRKKGEVNPKKIRPTKSFLHPELLNYISPKEFINYSSFKFEKNHFLVANCILDELYIYQKTLYLRQIGVDVLTEKDTTILPSHGLSFIPNKSFNNGIELGRIQALNYLSGKEIDVEFSDGIYLVTYENFGLGFIEKSKEKIINHYPVSKRIKMEWQTIINP